MSSPAAPFLLRTLGPLVLERVDADGTVAVVQRGGKPLALLAYLAAAGARPVPRATLADLLWGDEAPESTRASLRQAVHSLRKLLGDGAIVGERNDVMLAPGHVDSDLTRFVEAVESGRLQEAVEWYRGPFCAQLELRSAVGFERWVDAERQRLRRLLLRVADREVSTRRSAGDLKGAARLARAVHSVESTLSETAALFADALVAEGDRDGAHRLLESHRAQLLAAGEESPSTVESRLAGLDRAEAGRHGAASERPDAVDLGQRFVGREEVLAQLFKQMASARAGRTSHVLLVGPPGIGKSRVLDEFEARISTRGTRVARIRFLPAMRAIPGSALAEFARALCVLPGAMGVSETTASALVALLPEARALFPAAAAQESPARETMRRRAAAIADLLAAVSEDRLTVLLCDDEHNADPDSRAVLDAAFQRADLRLLDVRTSRVRAADGRIGREEIVLRPLSSADVQHLFASIGILPDEPWVASAIERLTSRTAGVPQLLLQRVRALGDRGALSIDGDRWQVRDPADLVAAASGTNELEETVGSLHPSARLALATLAQWRRPMKESDVLAVLGAFDPARASGEWRSALAELELRGLIVVRDEGWAVAHDTIAESSLEAQDIAEAEQIKFLFIRHFSESGALTVPMLEHLALLCGARGLLSAAAALVRAAARDRGLRSFGLTGRSLAGRIARASGHPEWEPGLIDAIGWWRRRSRGEVLSIGGIVGSALAVLVWLGWMLWPRLELESAPMSEPAGEFFPGAATLVIQPRVGVYNGFGRRLSAYRGSVRVTSPHRTLAGDTVRAIGDGQVQFEELVVTGVTPDAPVDSGAPELVFSASGPARDLRARLTGGWLMMYDGFRVVRASLNGVPLDSALRARVSVGDTLRFGLTFEYSTSRPTSNYVVGAAPSWLPHESSVIRLTGLPRPVRNAWQTVYFTVPPIQRAGTAHVIVLMGAEDSVDHLFSLTAWAVGPPIWNDGNDVQDLTPAQLARLRARGTVEAMMVRVPYRGRQSDYRLGDRLISRDQTGEVRRYPALLYGTALELDARLPLRRE